MNQKIRTFVAVDVSSAVRDGARDLIEQFRATGAEVKWVEPHNLHVTLKFLGDVDAGDIHQVCLAVEQAVADVAPFEFEVRGAGAFPDTRRPRTVWLGIAEGNKELVDLNDRIEPPLEKLGFRKEARRFQPHLTIGRVRRGGPAVAELGKLIHQHEDLPIGGTRVSEAIVFSSQLDRSGPTYEALARAPLGGK
jgi:2'-5' RNA ligase